MTWQYVILGAVGSQILKLLYLGFNQFLAERRQNRCLRMVQTHFPDNTKISFISIDTSDKRTMDKMEREIRERYEIPE